MADTAYFTFCEPCFSNSKYQLAGIKHRPSIIGHRNKFFSVAVSLLALMISPLPSYLGNPQPIADIVPFGYIIGTVFFVKISPVFIAFFSTAAIMELNSALSIHRLKMSALHRCFELEERIELISEDIGYSKANIHIWRKRYLQGGTYCIAE